MNQLPVEHVIFILSNSFVSRETEKSLRVFLTGFAETKKSLIVSPDICTEEEGEAIKMIRAYFENTSSLIEGNDCFEKLSTLQKQGFAAGGIENIFVVTTHHDLLCAIFAILHVFRPNVCYGHYPLNGLDIGSFRNHVFPISEIVLQEDGPIFFRPFFPNFSRRERVLQAKVLESRNDEVPVFIKQLLHFMSPDFLKKLFFM